MKKLLLLLTILLAAFAYAETPDKTKSNTPVLDAFLHHTTFSAEFVQENHYPGLDTFTHKGRVYIVRPEQAIWDYETPREYYLMRSGGVSHYSQSLNQLLNVNVSISDTDDPTAMLLSIFLDGSNVKKFFNVAETTTDGLTTARLTPIKPTTTEVVELRLKNGKIDNVFSRDSGGSTITIRFTNAQQNVKIDPSVFSPVLPDNTKVVNQ